MKKTIKLLIAAFIGTVALGVGQVQAQWALYWDGQFRVQTTSQVQVQLVDASGNVAGNWLVQPGQCGSPIQKTTAPLQASGSFCSDLGTTFYRLRYRIGGSGPWTVFRTFSLGTVWNGLGCQECDTVNGSTCGAPEMPLNYAIGTIYISCPTPTPTPPPSPTPTPTPTATPSQCCQAGYVAFDGSGRLFLTRTTTASGNSSLSSLGGCPDATANWGSVCVENVNTDTCSQEPIACSGTGSWNFYSFNGSCNQCTGTLNVTGSNGTANPCGAIPSVLIDSSYPATWTNTTNCSNSNPGFACFTYNTYTEIISATEEIVHYDQVQSADQFVHATRTIDLSNECTQ